MFLSEESIENSSELLRHISDYLKKMCPEGGLFYPFDSTFILMFPGANPDEAKV